MGQARLQRGVCALPVARGGARFDFRSRTPDTWQPTHSRGHRVVSGSSLLQPSHLKVWILH